MAGPPMRLVERPVSQRPSGAKSLGNPLSASRWKRIGTLRHTRCSLLRRANPLSSSSRRFHDAGDHNRYCRGDGFLPGKESGVYDRGPSGMGSKT